MNRRSVLVSLGVSVSVSTVAGCSALFGRQVSCTDDVTVDVDDVDVSPGASTAFTIDVEPVSTFSFDPGLYSCGPSDEPVAFGDVDIDPNPDRSADSCPPTWVWDECSSVTLAVPVEVAPDAEPGEYEYGFSFSKGTEESTLRDQTYTIIVSEK